MEAVKKPVSRKKPKRLTTYLTEETKTSFSRAVKKNKTTTQAILEEAVLKYIEENGGAK